MFIIYSVLRNVGPQPVGPLFLFIFFFFLTYLISKHHNVNFPLVRTVSFHFFSLLKVTRKLLVVASRDPHSRVLIPTCLYRFSGESATGAKLSKTFLSRFS